MTEVRDVIIIGGGVIGLSTAYQLARHSKLRVTLLEKGAAPGEGSSGASSAVCRHRYSLSETIKLARDGIRAYRHWDSFTGLRKPLADFHPDGVLWMPGSDRDWAPAEHRRMAAFGIKTEVLDGAGLVERFPAFSPCTQAPDTLHATHHDCDAGGLHLLETDAGWMDPMDVLADLVTACQREKVDIRFGTTAESICTASAAVTGVKLHDGRQVSSAVVVNAAGPWCRHLTASAGLALPWTLVPTRIQVLCVDRHAEIPGHIPVSVDMAGGIYFRTQNRGQQLVIGSTLEQDDQESVDNPDQFNRLVDDDFCATKLHALQHRIPAYAYAGNITGYCGLYTVNRDDVHPLVGPTAVEGLYLANGFSGHGFKLAPAIGALLLRQISGVRAEFDTEVPDGFLAVDRKPVSMNQKTVLA